MNPTTPPPAAARSSSAELADWLLPVVCAALLARLAGFVIGPFAYACYYQLTRGGVPPDYVYHGTVRELVAPIPMVIWVVWSALFSLAYRTWPSLRSDVATARGLFAVAGVFGTIVHLVIRYIVFRAPGIPLGLSATEWLLRILVIAPIVVWSIRRWSPRESAPRRVLAESTGDAPVETAPLTATGRGKGYGQVFAGLLLIVPSVVCMHWLATDPQAGYLMILGVFIFLGAIAVAMIGACLLLGGIWTVLDWPGRAWARLAPFLLTAAAALAVCGQWSRP